MRRCEPKLLHQGLPHSQAHASGNAMTTKLKTRAKICGLMRPEDVTSAIEYGAGFLGFIVEAPSKRRLSLQEAAALARPAQGILPRVAVTVNADDDMLARILAEMAPDYIQCHGEESPRRVAEIARKFRIKTIKACPIASNEDMISAGEFSSAADCLLFDAKPPAGSDVRGGHGIAIDWKIIARAPTPKTYMLAGGLTPETVCRAISVTGAPIVDVSSGVERSAGVKDARKIKAFMDAVNCK